MKHRTPFSFTRRTFVAGAGAFAPAMLFGGHQHQMPAMPPIPKLIDSKSVTPFVDPLPILPVSKSAGLRPDPSDHSKNIPYYRVPLREVSLRIHRDLKPTRFWTYGASMPGPTFETCSGQGLLVEWINELPHQHFLPIDHNLMGAEAVHPAVRNVVHVHGAKSPPQSDGYPENWFTPGSSAVYHYPNQQEATMLFYHDHAMGITRLNTYAGMTGLFIIRDQTENALNLPKGKYEVPLVICDRMFTADAQLFYPVSIRPEAPWVPEVFGDTILVNGKLLPYHNVEPRRYRLRLLNASNARFFRFSFQTEVACHQIGTDQGLLPAPVKIRTVTLAPGERADLLVDFSEHKGEQIILQNEANQILQFRVARTGTPDTSTLPATLRPVPRIPESAAVKTRQLTLEELDNVLDEPVTHLLNGARWHEPITENPVLDTTEIWSLLNMTEDVHPIHLHLVRFQILDRRPFDVPAYLNSKQLRYTGDAFPPEANEAGWKDTVRATPGAVTRIIVPFHGYAGRYVWHCHILEHEDNEMMRPYDVLPYPAAS